MSTHTFSARFKAREKCIQHQLYLPDFLSEKEKGEIIHIVLRAFERLMNEGPEEVTHEEKPQ